MSEETAEQVIARLKMQPIPEEGAWFAAGPRTQGLNAITVLLTDRPDGFSAMHRLSIDEGWQWLGGAPAALLRLRPGGSGVLNYVDAATSQFLVRRGTWMGASTLGRVEPAVVLVLPRLPPRALRAGRPHPAHRRLPVVRRRDRRAHPRRADRPDAVTR